MIGIVGAQFVAHSSIMPGDIHIEDTNSPIAKGLPRVWHRSEEWYSFASNPRKTSGVHIIASVDEKSYTPGRATMGDDHPLVWWHCVGKVERCTPRSDTPRRSIPSRS